MVRGGDFAKEDYARWREGERESEIARVEEVTWANMWLRWDEVGPGYDRFAWLAHIRQIHGSRSRIVEIPLPSPLFPAGMILGY